MNVACGAEQPCERPPTTAIEIEGLTVFCCDDEAHAAQLGAMLADYAGPDEPTGFRRLRP